MKWSSYLAVAGVAASLAAAPAIAAQDRAPQPRREQGDSARRMHAPGRMMGARMMAGPAERLLEHRSELALTADQVRRLEQIRDTRAAADKPHQETLRKLRETRREARGNAAPRDSAEPRRARGEAPPEARAAMEALRTSREAARKEAVAVLTPEQREKAHEMMEDRRERHREARERRSS